VSDRGRDPDQKHENHALRLAAEVPIPTRHIAAQTAERPSVETYGRLSVRLRYTSLPSTDRQAREFAVGNSTSETLLKRPIGSIVE